MKAEIAKRPARVFRNGNSVAVRLPKGWAKAGMTYTISRNGAGIHLAANEKKPRTLAEVLARMRQYDLADEKFVRVQPPYPVRDFD
jgi:virulence-associated protein VagC